MNEAIRVPFTVNDEYIRNEFLQNIALNAVSILSFTTESKWGSMKPHQMIEHLLMLLEISNGGPTIEYNADPKSLLKRKEFFYNDNPTPHNFKVSFLQNGLPSNKYKNIEESINAFKEQLNIFTNRTSIQIANLPVHPIFGPLNYEEWSRCHFKHIYHHFLQFGLIESI